VGRKGREGGKGWLENRSQQWKKENSRHKESSTQQVVRLAKYRSNFPSSNHTILVATSSSLLSSLPWEVVAKEERKASEKTKPKGLFGRPLFEKFLISKRVLGQIMCYNND